MKIIAKNPKSDGTNKRGSIASNRQKKRNRNGDGSRNSPTRRAFVAGLAGLGVVGTGSRPARAATTLRMWTFLDPQNGRSSRDVALKAIMDKFHDENPEIRVQVEPQNWQQTSDKFLAAHQTRTAPDIPWIFMSRVNGAIQLGSLANFDELFLQ